jgi:hypothetical protein
VKIVNAERNNKVSNEYCADMNIFLVPHCEILFFVQIQSCETTETAIEVNYIEPEIRV